MRICLLVKNHQAQLPTYTTCHLAVEALRAGHRVDVLNVAELSWQRGRVLGRVRPLLPFAIGDTFDLAEVLRGRELRGTLAPLDMYDVVWLRYNPGEYTAQQNAQIGMPVLDFARQLRHQGVLVMNDPDGLAKSSSKLYLAGFPQHIFPKTLVSRDRGEIRAFLRELGAPAILKPLVGYGGKNIFYVRKNEAANLNQMIEAIIAETFCIAQEYLPEAKSGDKRLLLWYGEPLVIDGRVAIYRRMRGPDGDIRNNIHAGGQPRHADAGEVEWNIARQLKPRLLQDGLRFVGVDIVGGKVLEINAFCSGGIHNINLLNNINVGKAIITDLERRVTAAAPARRLAAAHA